MDDALHGSMGRRLGSGLTGTAELPGVRVAGHAVDGAAHIGASTVDRSHRTLSNPPDFSLSPQPAPLRRGFALLERNP